MKENKCTCGGQITNEDSEWLGEDEKGTGRVKVTDTCLRCGKRLVYILKGM